MIFKQFNRICIMLAFLGIQSLYAQTVSGVVSDTNGEPLPGATVVKKGSTNGVVTDFDGKYTITNVDSNDTLIVSYIGFTAEEVVVNGRTTIDITLTESLSQLDEVVVIGYGTQLKEQISGSVASVNMDQLEKVPQVSVDQLIQGRAAGVSVTNNSGRPGGAVSVRIRGVGSINASSEPLYIIDGVPVSGDSRGATANSSGNLAGLNPSDIASVDVLKDASATAIYGSRGSNGVVIITTKKGKKSGGKINYSGYTAVQQPTNIQPVLDLPGYAALQNEMNEIFQLPQQVEYLRPDLLGKGTNWQKEIFDIAFLQNHQVSFSGGTDKTQYYLSTGYTNQEGTVKGSGFDRTSLRLNLDSQITDKIKVGLNLTVSRTNESIINNGNTNGVIALALKSNPGVAVFNADGSYAGPVTANEIALAVPNAIAVLENNDNDLRKDQLLGNLYAEIELFNNLKFRNEFGGNIGYNKNTIFQKSFAYGAISFDNPTLTKVNQNNDYYIIKNLLTYSNQFAGKHNVTILAGHEAQESSYNGVTARGSGFVDNNQPTLNNADADTYVIDEYKGSNALESYFGRLIYSFDSRYSVTASIRADGSSRFTEDNKWGYFPSVSGAWQVSNESFMENFDAVQNIKLYGGYGEVGNQEISNNPYLALLRTNATDLGSAFSVVNIPNPDVKWETSKQINLGLDFSLFNNHLNTTVEVYRKLNSDFLFQLGLTDFVLGGTGPGSIAPPWVNLGEMENKGIDVTLNFDTLSTGNFSWNSTLTFSHYRNEVLQLVDGLTINGQASLDDTNQVLTETKVGEPIGVFYGYETDGLFRTVDDLNNAPIQFGQPVGDASVIGRTWLGDVKFKDVNGDGVVDGSDRTVIGSPHPDFTFGWQNTFNYKGFDLGVFVQGSYGNEIFNGLNRSLTGSNLVYRNQLESVTDYWNIQNPNATHPRYTSNSTPNILISDRYVEDGSYLRIQNVRLGYQIPAKVFEKMGLSKVNIYTSVQNLYTFTNYSGYDPEVGALNQNPLLTGMDNGRYPIPRTFTFGVDIDF
ncbi:SusC/RagA family TonB-linked outer membrane protein [Maribacter sp. LLG6340-A2]|uniref:SusC/RagA family TonB-linked outer membrane protein n=1 Tax=Maribacter sp. LLG6340-A2 TaxID=3160834 RepID=UPI003865A42F